MTGCYASADAVLVLWMASVILVVLKWLTSGDPIYGGQSGYVGEQPVLLNSLAFMILEALAAGATWIFVWQAFSIDVRLTTAECSIEQNFVPGEKQLLKQKENLASDESGNSSTDAETETDSFSDGSPDALRFPTS